MYHYTLWGCSDVILYDNQNPLLCVYKWGTDLIRLADGIPPHQLAQLPLACHSLPTCSTTSSACLAHVGVGGWGLPACSAGSGSTWVFPSQPAVLQHSLAQVMAHAPSPPGETNKGRSKWEWQPTASLPAYPSLCSALLPSHSSQYLYIVCISNVCLGGFNLPPINFLKLHFSANLVWWPFWLTQSAYHCPQTVSQRFRVTGRLGSHMSCLF